MKPLLAVDGDSFAHRAFHALPRSFRRADGGPANTLVGFMSMLLRLWQACRIRPSRVWTARRARNSASGK